MKSNRRVNIKEILQDPQKKRELIEGVVEFFKRCRHWF